jgi:hypothetical protein
MEAEMEKVSPLLDEGYKSKHTQDYHNKKNMADKKQK